MSESWLCEVWIVMDTHPCGQSDSIGWDERSQRSCARAEQRARYSCVAKHCPSHLWIWKRPANRLLNLHSPASRNSPGYPERFCCPREWRWCLKFQGQKTMTSLVRVTLRTVHAALSAFTAPFCRTDAVWGPAGDLNPWDLNPLSQNQSIML